MIVSVRFLFLCTLLCLGGGPAAARDFPAPGGRLVLTLVSREMRMSHWIDEACVLRTQDATIVWSCKYPWSVSAHEWIDPEELSLELRKYPGERPPVQLRLRFGSKTFCVGDDDWSQERPLSEVERWLDNW